MVAFGKRLSSQKCSEYEGYYLDYSKLKKFIKADNSSAAGSEANFKLALDREIEKVVLFFLKTQGEIASSLEILRSKQSQVLQSYPIFIKSSSASSTAFATLDETETALGEVEDDDDQSTQLRELADGYRSIGDSVIKLLQYVDLNVTAVRKILKKHDKNRSAAPMTRSYLSAALVKQPQEGVRRSRDDSHLLQLYQYEGISALVTTIRGALTELSTFEKKRADRRQSIELVEPVLLKIETARRRLGQSSSYARNNAFAAQALIFDAEEEEEDEGQSYETFARLAKAETKYDFSNTLNLFSTFLYMANYYIVAPTSGLYAAQLGASQAFASLIIGMTPVAACVSAVLYSWWANRSYKSALLFASCCSIAGNFIYALGLPLNSLPLVFTGRILNGFGGARAINRRYIADSFKHEERTAASAAFVTAGALGMAAGPAAAVVLDYFLADSASNSRWIANENSPGWLMGTVWTLYFIMTAIFFKEPPKRSSNSNAKDESTSLLLPLNDKEPSSSMISRLWNNFPVVATLVCYFVLKLVLECLLSSSAIMTSFYFNWSLAYSGMYLAFLGLCMFPANMIVAFYISRTTDRQLILSSLYVLLGGIVVFSNLVTSSYYEVQYVIGSLVIFLSTNILEGVSMSLLSKTIPPSLAKGTFNSGLLATEAGTIGRAVGDNFITLAVGLFGMARMLNVVFIPLGLCVVGIIIYINRGYEKLIVPEEDEDD